MGRIARRSAQPKAWTRYARPRSGPSQAHEEVDQEDRRQEGLHDDDDLPAGAAEEGHEDQDGVDDGEEGQEHEEQLVGRAPRVRPAWLPDIALPPLPACANSAPWTASSGDRVRRDPAVAVVARSAGVRRLHRVGTIAAPDDREGRRARRAAIR